MPSAVSRAPAYNWIGLGWWAGCIKRPSGDKSKMVKVDGQKQPANFIVQYTDGTEGPHCLTLDKYGKGRVSEGERWVVLERGEEGEGERDDWAAIAERMGWA